MIELVYVLRQVCLVDGCILCVDRIEARLTGNPLFDISDVGYRNVTVRSNTVYQFVTIRYYTASFRNRRNGRYGFFRERAMLQCRDTIEMIELVYVLDYMTFVYECVPGVDRVEARFVDNPFIEASNVGSQDRTVSQNIADELIAIRAVRCGCLACYRCEQQQ